MDGRRFARFVAATAACVSVAACAQQPRVAANSSAIQPVSYTAQDRECMARAMYFESHRGADEGMLAVGTVIANRKDSGRYGASICEIVAQKRQFAAGVMTRTMDGEAADRARRAADTVLSGKRHPGVKGAMFFHTAGLKFRYPNMHYVLVAGGNAFYEKREVETAQDATDNARSKALAFAYARIDPTGAAKPIVLASADKAQAPVPKLASTVAALPQAPGARAATTQVAAATPVVAQPTIAQPAPTQVAAVTVKAPVPTARPAAVAEAQPVAVAAYAPPAAQTASPIKIAPKRVIEPKTEPALASVTPVVKHAEPKVAAKRVIEPKTPPALASSMPAVSAPAAVAQSEPVYTPTPGYVSAAFAAFN